MPKYWIFLTFAYCFVIKVTATKNIGPSFVQQLPSQVIFYNNTGAIVPCVVSGTPRPDVMWITQDNHTVHPIPNIRHVRQDGSLVFSPFAPEDYRQDVHSAVYRCSTSNIVGSVMSRNVNIRGVLFQNFDARVYDEFVIRGNIGVMRCNIPSHVRDYISVSSWKRDDGLVIVHQRLNENDKYIVFPSGELHIRNVDYTDSHSIYKCHVRNSLTRQTKESISGGRIIITEPRANVPPRMTHAIREIRAQQGEVVLLPCVAQGHPAPKYRWSRRNTGQLLDVKALMEDKREYQLDGAFVLNHVTVQDSGTYICIAFTEAGEVRTEVLLTVRARIKTVMWPQSQDVNTGSSVTINCTVSGHPITSVQWTKNQKPLTLSRRVTLLGHTVLHISVVQREDRGIYQCFAFNDDDSAEASSQLTIASERPVLTAKFEELVVKAGDTVSLRCTAVGNPLPQITWYSYDIPVQDTSRIRVGDYVSREGTVISFINVSRADIRDGGQYECRASNEYGEDSFSAVVHVRGPPMVNSMRNRTVVAGDILIIHCPLSGYPIHSVRWKKGNKQLPLGRRQKVFTNGSLIIQGLDGREDEGRYSCHVENNEGLKASSEVHVKVLVPPEITRFAFPKNTQEGMRASVTCSVPTGDPPIRISWLKDDHQLSLDSGISLEMLDDFISALIFKSLRQDHSGIYTCVASNDAAVVNMSATLSVSATPRWRIEPGDQFVAVGGKVVLDCVADGRPDPRVIWKKSTDESSDYRTVISGSHIQTLVNGSLVISDVEQEDDARYMCEASNGVGSPLSTVVKLTVHVPAHFKQKFLSQTVRQGESVKLRCEAFGEKPMNYLWLKDRQPFSGHGHPRYVLREQMLNYGHLSELTIHVVERQDNGLYTCVASNAYGQDEKNNQLLVQEKPDPPQNLEAIHTSGRNIVMRWIKPFNGNSPIIKYILEYTTADDAWNGHIKRLFLNGDQQQIKVEDLSPMTRYSIRVYAENAIGMGLSSAPLDILTEGEVPGGPPRNIHAAAIDSRTIQVTWQPPQPSLQHGYIKGYYVGYRIAGSGETFVYKTVEGKEDQETNTCDITDLRSDTKYTFVVQAYNEKGAGPLSDEVVVRTLEFDPPSPPELKVTAATSSSITLMWNRSEPPVSGYILHWREKGLEWQEEQLPYDKTRHEFENLNCGTRYQFYIIAFNSIGKGQPSEVVSAQTEGTAPIAPSEHTFIARNSTTFLLRLSAWKSGGCTISFFVIQYKQQKQLDWTLHSTRIEANEEVARITDLNAGTWYNILVSAHNVVGVTEVEYVTSTLTTTGGTVLPEVVGEQEQLRKYKSLSIIVPVASAVLVLIAVSLAVFFLVCRKRNTIMANHYEGVRANEDAKGDTIAMSELEKSCEQSRESVYFPAPYATSRVPVLPRDDDRMSRDVCRSLHHHNSRASDHLYDMPQRIRDDEMRRHSYHVTSESETISINCYAESKNPNLQSITEEGLSCDLEDFILLEKLSLASRWTPTHRWCPNDIVSRENTYSPLHVSLHPQTLVIDGPELSDAECDRDLRIFVPDNEHMAQKIVV